MKRLLIAAAPLLLAAQPVTAQDHSAHRPAPDPHAHHRTAPSEQDPHAGHAMPVDPHAGHDMPPPAADDPHAGHEAPADPHAGHDMSGQAADDPHAGHDMGAAAADPHAGHVMPADPHAGHDMSGQAADDPHAGHDMDAPVADPHAGHAMPGDPHAGHDMSGQTADPHAGHHMGPADTVTSADTPGRPPQAPPPAAAFSGPVHAADLIFGSAEMASAREQMRRENGDVRTTAVIIDRLEAGFGDGEETFLWDVQGWSGGDIQRFWWKTEAEGEFGERPHEIEAQALYSRAVTPFWDVQAGVRHDFRRGDDDSTHLVFGVQGLAPHWWEVDAAAFLSTDGDLTARVEAEYDQRITQRLILQPRIEVEASAGDIPDLGVGSGLSSVELGLRLRYELTGRFAPYAGVEWSRALGDTADFARSAGDEVEETRFVVGLRAWF